jgi:hypothetical protein
LQPNHSGLKTKPSQYQPCELSEIFVLNEAYNFACLNQSKRVMLIVVWNVDDLNLNAPRDNCLVDNCQVTQAKERIDDAVVVIWVTLLKLAKKTLR